MADTEAKGQGQCRPYSEQLPGIGAGLIGLPEVGEQAPNSEAGQHAQGKPRSGSQQGASQHHHHHTLQEGEMPRHAQHAPIGGNPENDAQSGQGGAQDGNTDGDGARNAVRLLIEPREVVQPGCVGRRQPVLIGQLGQCRSQVHW